MKSWRQLYPAHPCAEVFNMLRDDELDALANDINENGLRTSVDLWRADTPDSPTFVVDGRNRLEALARLGVTFRSPGCEAEWPDGVITKPFRWLHCREDDLAAYVISANIRRRHLTKEQQAELIVRAIEAGKRIDCAKVARSFNPTPGQKGGSTKDPVLAAAIDKGKKHDISERTMKRARAKVQGKQLAPRKTVAAEPVSKETIDEALSQLRRRGDQLIADYIALLTTPGLTLGETQVINQRLIEWRKQFDARVTDVASATARRRRTEGHSPTG